MRVEINKHALDRVPISIIFDDSTVLVNLNYFFMRDRQAVDGTDYRWEDVPVVHPESFTREFAEFCLEHDVKGQIQRGAVPRRARASRSRTPPVLQSAARKLVGDVQGTDYAQLRHHPGNDHTHLCR